LLDVSKPHETLLS